MCWYQTSNLVLSFFLSAAPTPDRAARMLFGVYMVAVGLIRGFQPLCGVHVHVTFTLQRLDHEAEDSLTPFCSSWMDGWMSSGCSHDCDRCDGSSTIWATPSRSWSLLGGGVLGHAQVAGGHHKWSEIQTSAVKHEYKHWYKHRVWPNFCFDNNEHSFAI